MRLAGGNLGSIFEVDKAGKMARDADCFLFMNLGQDILHSFGNDGLLPMRFEEVMDEYESVSQRRLGQFRGNVFKVTATFREEMIIGADELRLPVHKNAMAIVFVLLAVEACHDPTRDGQLRRQLLFCKDKPLRLICGLVAPKHIRRENIVFTWSRHYTGPAGNEWLNE